MSIRAAALGVSWSCGVAGASEPIFEDYKLCEADGAASDYFGRCVEVGGELIMVGISRDDDYLQDSGSVYCYVRATGDPINKLFPDDAEPGDLFGASVAYGGEGGEAVIAVGSVRDDDNGVEDSGSVYLFDPVSGLQVKKLRADEPGEEDYFGGPLAIEGSVLAVGVRCDDDNGSDAGSVLLFDTTTGRQTRTLLADDGGANDWMGTSVAIGGGRVIAGAVWNDNANGVDAGAAYVFDAATGQQVAKLLAPDGSARDYFGAKVAIGGGVIAAQASGDEHAGQAGTGSVYLFDAVSLGMIGKLVPPEDGGAVHFDGGLKLLSRPEGVLLAVGAAVDDPLAPHDRAVYVYALGAKTPPHVFYPSESLEADDFGYQIALGEGELIVGAPAFFGLGAGAAYRFALPGPAADCPPDLNGDGALNFFDVSVFLSDRPDFNGDGRVNFFDVSDFVSSFLAGCP